MNDIISQLDAQPSDTPPPNLPRCRACRNNHVSVAESLCAACKAEAPPDDPGKVPLADATIRQLYLMHLLNGAAVYLVAQVSESARAARWEELLTVARGFAEDALRPAKTTTTACAD